MQLAIATVIGVVAGGLGTYVTVQLLSKDIAGINEDVHRIEGDHKEHIQNHLLGIYGKNGNGVR